MPKFYTSAPEAYDGFGTKTITENAFVSSKGQPVRLVETNPVHTDWQQMRYSSGLHLCVPESDVAEYLDLALFPVSEPSTVASHD